MGIYTLNGNATASFLYNMIKNTLIELLSPVVSALGYELWGCEYLAQGKYSLLRIYIDKTSGVGIEDCEIVSRQISAVLDVEDPLPGNYNLEVSTPGIPKPLFFDWQYERYTGSEVQVKLHKPIANNRKLVGIIGSVNNTGIVLNIGQEQQEIPFSNIVKANLTV